MLAFFVGLLFFIVGAVFIGGLRKVLNDPPCFAVITYWGRRTNLILTEGWHWLFPGVYGLILVLLKKRDVEIPAMEVRTPNKALSAAPLFWSWRPNPKKLIEFLNSGEDKGVEKKLNSTIIAKFRQWAMSREEGPQNHMELQASGNEAIAVLAKTILGDVLPKIPSAIPTPILFKYFTCPRPDPTETEEIKWGKKWTDLEKILKTENPTQEQMDALKSAVNKRRKEISELQRVNSEYPIDQLGIILLGLNMGDIKLLGKVAETADLTAKEEEEKKGEEVEMKHAENMIKTRAANLNITTETATELFQTQTGKVKKEISEKKLNLSPETREMIKEVIPEIAKIFKKEA